ncbi:Protein-S-isoprenylcysteine O-methyltransferase [Lamellibrachia satsuma]|nr:Protein-S-isoprenylcysteine O-methyltransferase [Lamellibrachia satsuma]
MYVLASYVVAANAVVFLLYQGEEYQVAVRSCLLGLGVGLGWFLSASSLSCSLFGWYIITLSFFHWSEYFTIALTNPTSLGLESFLLDHSFAYHMAVVGSITEFAFETYFFPGMKTLTWLPVIGVALVVSGELLRKSAMFTASSNFDHYVQSEKKPNHQLVTSGVYSWVRHPSYVGWFYWSIGTQVMLCNPVCLIGYIAASWMFFKSRIEYEEFMLLNFFGDDYIAYQNRVATGLPFIGGYQVPQVDSDTFNDGQGQDLTTGKDKET